MISGMSKPSRVRFTIDQCIPREPPVYKIKDYDGEEIIGSFYEHELHKIALVKEKLYHIDKILPKREQRGQVYFLVKWRNWPDFEWRKKGDAEQRPDYVVKMKIRAGFYEDTLRAEIEACLRRIDSDIYLKYHPIVKKFEFTAGGIYQLRFFPPLAYMLGVPAGVW